MPPVGGHRDALGDAEVLEVLGITEDAPGLAAAEWCVLTSLWTSALLASLLGDLEPCVPAGGR